MKPSSPWDCLLGSNKRLPFQALPWHYPVNFFFFFQKSLPPAVSTHISCSSHSRQAQDSLRAPTALLSRCPPCIGYALLMAFTSTWPWSAFPKVILSPITPTSEILFFPVILPYFLLLWLTSTAEQTTPKLVSLNNHHFISDSGSEIWARLNLVVFLLHIWWNEVIRWNSSSE